MGFLDHEQLQALTGYKGAADIAVCLRNQGIKFVAGKRGRIWTTSEAVNAAMGLVVQSDINQKIVDQTDPYDIIANMRPGDFEV